MQVKTKQCRPPPGRRELPGGRQGWAATKATHEGRTQPVSFPFTHIYMVAYIFICIYRHSIPVYCLVSQTVNGARACSTLYPHPVTPPPLPTEIQGLEAVNLRVV